MRNREIQSGPFEVKLYQFPFDFISREPFAAEDTITHLSRRRASFNHRECARTQRDIFLRGEIREINRCTVAARVQLNLLFHIDQQFPRGAGRSSRAFPHFIPHLRASRDVIKNIARRCKCFPPLHGRLFPVTRVGSGACSFSCLLLFRIELIHGEKNAASENRDKNEPRNNGNAENPRQEQHGFTWPCLAYVRYRETFPFLE